MWPMEPQARTSTILNPTGSFDFRRLTYSLARTSPASKWVTPFCSGTCFATFSLWKLKNTNLPRKRDSPVLRLITRGALSSAFSAKLFLGLVVVILVREVLALMRGLRPWNGVRLWRCFWIVGVKNKAEVAIGGDCGGGSRENFGGDRWRASILQERNAVENVYRWACGRPTALQDRTRDSDDDDLHDRDYDVAALANNLSQAFRYKMYGNKDNEEDHGGLDRDDEDVYFDDESAEVVISSLRLGDDQGSSLFTNSNWFAFQDDRVGNAPVSTSPMEIMDEINLNGAANGGNSSSDDEVVVGEDDELTESKDTVNSTSTSNPNFANGFSGSVPIPQSEKTTTPQDIGFFRFDTPGNDDLFRGRPFPAWVGWGETSDLQVGGSSLNPFEDHDISHVNLSNQAEVATHDVNSPSSGESILPNGSSPSKDSSDGSVGSDTSHKSATLPSLFEEDVEFVGVELEGTEKAMEQALKEGIVGEAGPLKRNIIPKVTEKENSDDGGAGIKEFNDANYWRVDQEVAVLE